MLHNQAVDSINHKARLEPSVDSESQIRQIRQYRAAMQQELRNHFAQCDQWATVP
jgi:hypothetical protein